MFHARTALHALSLRTRDESGFSLVELLLASALMSIVLIAIFTVLEVSASVVAKDHERPLAINAGQVGLYTMTRDLRQATTVFSVTSTRVDFQRTISGQDYRILYACDVASAPAPDLRCVRAASTTLTSTPSLANAAPVVERLINNTTLDPSDPVFTLVSSSFLRVRVLVPAGGTAQNGYRSSTVFDDGVYLRNLGTQ